MAADNQNDTEATVTTSRKKKPATRKRAAKRNSGGGSRARSRTASARSLTRGYKRAATGLMRSGQRLAGDAQTWVESARGAVTRNMHLPSPPTLETFTEASPVVLGAVGLGIGVLIGALLPRDAFHTGMQGMGLAARGATSTRAPAKRRKSRSRR